MPALNGLRVPVPPGRGSEEFASEFENLGLTVEWAPGDGVIYLAPGQVLDGDAVAQIDRLRWWAGLVSVWLVGAIVASSVILGRLYNSYKPESPSALRELALLAFVAGALGSAVAALVSCADRIAHGWELRSGAKHPAVGSADRFVGRMVPMFLARPLLGAGTGVLVYFGVRGGLLLASESTPSPSTEALVFLELLGGLFAKSLVERLKQTFDFLVGVKS